MLYLMGKSSSMLNIQDYLPSGLACENDVITIFTRDIWRKNVYTISYRQAIHLSVFFCVDDW